MKRFLKTVYDYYLHIRRLKNIRKLNKMIQNDVSILSMNCFGGRIYQDLKREYLSPTAGLFFYIDDFILLLKDIHILDRDIVECSISKWEHTKEIISQHGGKNYPIGVFKGTNIEIHFLHYHSFEEAVKKWKRRMKRFNYEKFLVIAFQQNECTERSVYEFANLELRNKILFCNNQIDLPDICFIKEFANRSESPDPYKYAHIYYDYLVKILENHPI